MRDITIITIPRLLPHQIAKGHSPHRSGAGKYLDKRTKRIRTRNAAFRNSLKQSEGK
jgi:hypothetical protein